MGMASSLSNNWPWSTASLCNSKVLLLTISTLPPIVIFLTIGARSAATETECASLAASANCSFYDVCIEDVMPCGSSGYAKGYGEKYCQRFDEPEYNDRFNEEVSTAVVTLAHKETTPSRTRTFPPVFLLVKEEVIKTFDLDCTSSRFFY